MMGKEKKKGIERGEDCSTGSISWIIPAAIITSSDLGDIKAFKRVP